MLTRNLRNAWLSLGLLLSFAAHAATTSPYQIIEDVSGKLMSTIKGGEQTLKTHPDDYYASLSKVLEPAVNFDFIAQAVMADAWQKANEAQRRKFTEIFKLGMVKTLAKGLAAYSNLTISLVPPSGDLGAQKRVEVLQQVTGGEKTHQVTYTMQLDKNGDWKLINVILNGVSLGKSYREQFAQTLKQSNNNIDTVINDWNSDTKS